MRLGIFALFLVLALTPTRSSAARQNDEPIYLAGNGVTLPQVTKSVVAQYTPDAMQKRVQGEVVLTCVVAKTGVPARIEVTKSLEEGLDAAAIRALEQWRFEAGTKDGEPVAVRITIEMTFTLK